MNQGSGEKTGGTMETADVAAKRTSAFPVFTTGSGAFDALLGGGYRAGTLTLLYGRSNSGKTQLAMQAAMMRGRAGGRTLFVDTEGSFRPERVEEMARARGWDAGGILDKTVYVRCDSASEQMETVRRMRARAATITCDLVVIDTLTRNFSVELPGRKNMASRQAELNIHLSEMSRDAYLNGRAYLLTNRVTFGSAQDVGIGGRTVEQLVHRTLALERTDGALKATIVASGESASANLGMAGVE